MNTFELPVTALRAHMLIAPKKDVRFYLCGVFLDATRGALVSTDGSRLLITKHETLKTGADSLILPGATLASVLKQCPKRAETLRLEVDGSRLMFHPAPGIVIGADAIDGRYPDYARVVPLTVDGTPGTYDPSVMAGLADALQLLGNRRTQQEIRVYQNGADKAAWVMLDGSAGAVEHLGIIMPCRVKNGDSDEAAAARIAAVMS